MSESPKYPTKDVNGQVSCPLAHELEARNDDIRDISESLKELAKQISGLRSDLKNDAIVLRDAALQRAAGMMPIRSHYIILFGSLTILLGIEIVKQLLMKI